MPRYGNQPQQPITYLRTAKDKPRKEMDANARDYITALVDVVLNAGDGIYIGMATTTGTVKLRIYGPDGPAETYVGSGDNPADVLGQAVDQLYGAAIETELHVTAGRRANERAAKAADRRKPTRGTTPEPTEAPGASEGP